jgi:hypothetical protein
MKLKKLLLAPLLIIIGLNAETMTGTTLGHYSKPGAPIDMKYVTTNVDKNETSDINITLIPTVRNGTMVVQLTLDDELHQITSVGKELRFEITPKKRAYTFNMQVSSQKDGLYYIRLLTRIDKGIGSKMRAFAVPVTIGKGKKSNITPRVMMKSHSGEHISVSRAVETIRVVK